MQSSSSSSIWSSLGVFLGTVGLGLFAYSIYILFFIPERQDIINTLPSENFEFLLFANTDTQDPDNTITVHKDIASLFPFSIPENGAVAGYKNPESGETEFITLSKEENTDTGQECREAKGYTFCSNKDSSTTLFSVLETLDTQYRSLKYLIPFQSSEEIFIEDSNYSFIGSTSFLVEYGESLNSFFLLSQENTLSQILSVGSDALPFFSGNIRFSDNLYTFGLYKRNGGMVFPGAMGMKMFDASLLHPNTDTYIYMRQPEQIISFLEQNLLDTSFPLFSELKAKAKTWSVALFSGKVDWAEDILPLLSTDILYTGVDDEKGVYFSFPSVNTSILFSQQFSDILSAVASEIVPEKKGFALGDGSTIYEIVPSNKNTVETNETSADGEISFFQTTAFGENTSVDNGVVRQGSVMLLSDSMNISNHFWNTNKENSNFVFPIDPSIFFSLGMTGDNNTVYSAVEVTGKEDERKVLFVGKITWNSDVLFPQSPRAFSVEEENAL